MENLENLQIKNKGYIIFQVMNASLGSFFSGYSIAYLNISIQSVTSIYQLQEDLSIKIGLLQSMMTIGGLFGSLVCSYILARQSKRNCMIICDILGITGYLIQEKNDFSVLLITRLFIGVIVGINQVTLPLYIFEMSPLPMNGYLGCMNQLFFSTGILVSFLIGLLQETMNQNQFFSLLITIPLIPCILRTLSLIFCFQFSSPIEYIKMGNDYQQNQYLNKIYSHRSQEIIKRNIQKELKNEQENVQTYVNLFSETNKKQTFLAIFLVGLQQFSGINSIIFYSTLIFLKITNNNQSLSYKLNIIVALIGFLSAIGIAFTVQKLGRQKVLVTGSFICGVSMFMISYFAIDQNSQYSVLVFLFIYLFSFGFSLGPITFVCLSEIVSDKGMSLSMMFSWGFSSIVAYIFPVLVEKMSISITFLIFGLLCIIGAFITKKFLPETSGKSRAQIYELFHIQNVQSSQKAQQFGGGSIEQKGNKISFDDNDEF